MSEEHLYKNSSESVQKISNKFSGFVAWLNIVVGLFLVVTTPLVLIMYGTSQSGFFLIILSSMICFILLTGLIACLFVCKQHLRYMDWAMGELLQMTGQLVKQGEQEKS